MQVAQQPAPHPLTPGRYPLDTGIRGMEYSVVIHPRKLTLGIRYIYIRSPQISEGDILASSGNTYSGLKNVWTHITRCNIREFVYTVSRV